MDQSGSLSNPIPTTCGVHQGCLLAPALFNVYINSLITELSHNDNYVPPKLGTKKLSILMDADDILLLSQTQQGLRSLLEAFNHLATQENLKNIY